MRFALGVVVLAVSAYLTWSALGSTLSAQPFGRERYQSASAPAPSSSTSPALPERETLALQVDRHSFAPSLYTVPSDLHPRGLNIVFISQGFGNQSEFLMAAEKLEHSLLFLKPRSEERRVGKECRL